MTKQTEPKYFFQASDGRSYQVLRMACTATLGTSTQYVHIKYANGLKAVISDVEHKANLQFTFRRAEQGLIEEEMVRRTNQGFRQLYERGDRKG